jgi:hypothetical protein
MGPYVNKTKIILMLDISPHGKRSLPANQKMINISRVELVHPALNANSLIMNEDSFAVMIASLAFQSLAPSELEITFDDCPYNLLSNSMIPRFANPRNYLNVR